MMHPKTTIFCKDVGPYSDQLTKGKQYLIQERNESKVRIRNDADRLRWYADSYFDLEQPPEITSIHLDDQIENPACDRVEVTIALNNGEKYWTTFTTPDYLKSLLQSNRYFSMEHLILLSELSEARIQETIMEMYRHDELLGNCKK